MVSAYPATHVDGGIGRIDSTAVDAEGNIYQAFHERAEILVFAKTGEQVGRIRVPGDGLESATNIAIAPGTTDGYLVVSGPAGGFVHTFEAYGEGDQAVERRVSRIRSSCRTRSGGTAIVSPERAASLRFARLGRRGHAGGSGPAAPTRDVHRARW